MANNQKGKYTNWLCVLVKRLQRLYNGRMNQHVYRPTTFHEFFLSLPKEQRARFADIAGTTESYIAVKLVRAAAVPRPDQMQRLWEACEAYRAPFTRTDLLKFFYPENRA